METVLINRKIKRVSLYGRLDNIKGIIENPTVNSRYASSHNRKENAYILSVFISLDIDSDNEFISEKVRTASCEFP